MHRRHLPHVLLPVAALLVVVPTPTVAGQETDTSMLPAGIHGEVLAEVEIPADALPAGETAAMLARFTWKANTADAVPAGTLRPTGSGDQRHPAGGRGRTRSNFVGDQPSWRVVGSC